MSYLFSNLSKATLGWLNVIMSSGKNRSDAFAIALGYILAQKLSLPPEQVEGIVEYYKLNHQEVVIGYIDNCNETIPLNTRKARQAVEAFYAYRYYSLFPSKNPLALNKDSSIEDFFGLSKCFSKDFLGVVEKEGEELTHFVNHLGTMIEEIDQAMKVTQGEEERDVYVA